VIGEEFGLIACAVIVPALSRHRGARVDEAAGRGGCVPAARRLGPAAQFGVQAMINMAVNTGIAPSKGMTLPFISYGGSSMMALSIGYGLLARLHAAKPVSEALPIPFGGAIR
jgi:cell division protein FtsW